MPEDSPREFFAKLASQTSEKWNFTAEPGKSQTVGVAFYDYTTQAPPIGTFYLPWETLKPVLKAWMSGLKRDVPDDPAKLPSYNQWLDTWDRLYRDLQARAVKMT